MPSAKAVELKFDHDPRAGSSADCPSEKCAGRSKRRAYVDRFRGADGEPFDILRLDTTGFHAFLDVDRKGEGEFTLYRPSDELLEQLALACTGEIARRQEARAQREAPPSCNCYSGGHDDCPVHGADGVAV